MRVYVGWTPDTYQHRAAVRSELEALDHELIDSDPRGLVKFLRNSVVKQIESSDFVLLVVGRNTGTPSAEESVVELDYRVAYGRKKPRRVLLGDDIQSMVLEHFSKRLGEFRKELTEHEDPLRFDLGSVSDLRRAVREAAAEIPAPAPAAATGVVMNNQRSNAVFISYRRDVAGMLAALLYQHLTERGLDAFYDIESIRAGHFDTIILNQIAARPYFVLVLTPGTLERCDNPNDWLRREIEQALATERMVVPVHTSNFDFRDVERFLPAGLGREVGRFNGQELPHRFFKLAVQQLVDEFLVPREVPESPAVPESEQAFIDRAVRRAQAGLTVTKLQLLARESEYFERGRLVRPDDDLASELIAGLSLLVAELHRRTGDSRPSERENVRAALLQLENYLDAWTRQAKGTNALARSWAELPPEAAGGAKEMLLDSMDGQSMYSASVESSLALELPELIPPLGLDKSRHANLEQLLRVYAPEFYDFLVAFSNRREQLDAMIGELESRRANGRDAIEEYLAELDRAAQRLEEARSRLAEFIATEFPV